MTQQLPLNLSTLGRRSADIPGVGGARGEGSACEGNGPTPAWISNDAVKLLRTEAERKASFLLISTVLVF